MTYSLPALVAVDGALLASFLRDILHRTPSTEYLYLRVRSEGPDPEGRHEVWVYYDPLAEERVLRVLVAGDVEALVLASRLRDLLRLTVGFDLDAEAAYQRARDAEDARAWEEGQA